MKDLFKGVPLPKDFKDVTETITVLPISLANFYQLFYSNDAVYFNDSYIEYSNPGKNLGRQKSKS